MGTVLVTVLLLAANAFFVGAEFAAMSARRSQLEPLAESGSKGAKVALDALQHTGILLATSQLGITVCSVLLGAVSEAALHHAFVPVAGEAENGFRKFIAAHSDEGLRGISIGQSPGLVAISIKAAISALKGNPMPQLISVPLPVADYTTLEDGANYWSELPDNFFTVNEFPPCGVNISGPAIMSQNQEDVL